MAADALSRYVSIISVQDAARGSRRSAIYALSHHLPVAFVRNAADALLVPQPKDSQVILVPQAAVVETLHRYHDQQGHFCANTVMGKLRANKLYWPTMATDVARYVRSCEIC